MRGVKFKRSLEKKSGDERALRLHYRSRGRLLAHLEINGNRTTIHQSRLKSLCGLPFLFLRERNDLRFYDPFKVCVFHSDRLLVIAGIENNRLIPL